MSVKASIRSLHTLDSVPAAPQAIAIPVLGRGFQTPSGKKHLPFEPFSKGPYRIFVMLRSCKSARPLRNGIRGRLDQPKRGNHQPVYHVTPLWLQRLHRTADHSRANLKLVSEVSVQRNAAPYTVASYSGNQSAWLCRASTSHSGGREVFVQHGCSYLWNSAQELNPCGCNDIGQVWLLAVELDAAVQSLDFSQNQRRAPGKSRTSQVI
jgi:hypothetical protein